VFSAWIDLVRGGRPCAVPWLRSVVLQLEPVYTAKVCCGATGGLLRQRTSCCAAGIAPGSKAACSTPSNNKALVGTQPAPPRAAPSPAAAVGRRLGRSGLHRPERLELGIRPVVAWQGGGGGRGPGGDAWLAAEACNAARTAPRPSAGGAAIAMRWACCWAGNRPSLRLGRPASSLVLALKLAELELGTPASGESPSPCCLLE